MPSKEKQAEYNATKKAKRKKKRFEAMPEAEREKGVTYDSNIFNLGNPIGVKI